MEKATTKDAKHLWELEDLAKAQELARWYLENFIEQGIAGQSPRRRPH